jgi:hypothetical protein
MKSFGAVTKSTQAIVTEIADGLVLSDRIRLGRPCVDRRHIPRSPSLLTKRTRNRAITATVLRERGPWFQAQTEDR